MKGAGEGASSGRTPCLQDRLKKRGDSLEPGSGRPESSPRQSGTSPVRTEAWPTGLDREEGFEENKVIPPPVIRKEAEPAWMKAAKSSKTGLKAERL